MAAAGFGAWIVQWRWRHIGKQLHHFQPKIAERLFQPGGNDVGDASIRARVTNSLRINSRTAADIIDGGLIGGNIGIQIADKIKTQLVFCQGQFLPGKRLQKHHVGIADHKIVGVSLNMAQRRSRIPWWIIDTANPSIIRRCLNSAPRLANPFEPTQQGLAVSMDHDDGRAAQMSDARGVKQHRLPDHVVIVFRGDDDVMHLNIGLNQWSCECAIDTEAVATSPSGIRLAVPSRSRSRWHVSRRFSSGMGGCAALSGDRRRSDRQG